jgi:toxin-antitoxin system PIN domain toxin
MDGSLRPYASLHLMLRCGYEDYGRSRRRIAANGESNLRSEPPDTFTCNFRSRMEGSTARPASLPQAKRLPLASLLTFGSTRHDRTCQRDGGRIRRWDISRRVAALIWLFDVNVLIAIVDPAHVFHTTIHGWLQRRGKATWSSCAITENGMIRVLSQPAYRGISRTPSEVIALLRTMKQSRSWTHTFWADEYSVADAASVVAERLVAPGQITDVYLAALAMRKGDRLVSFDRGIPWQAIPGGSAGLIENPALTAMP